MVINPERSPFLFKIASMAIFGLVCVFFMGGLVVLFYSHIIILLHWLKPVWLQKNAYLTKFKIVGYWRFLVNCAFIVTFGIHALRGSKMLDSWFTNLIKVSITLILGN
ncbi:hypothetical protein HC931_07580 [Candidatus Gracilibacteria bacterium]|nr:hypothetical protein [Candidatus Gracilibacteria bacterium]